MKRLKSRSRYQFISLLHELLLLFISSFISFPSHVKRIILCFVYSDDYQPSFIYPSLEEDLQPACIVEVDSVFLPQPIHKDDHCISFPLESDQPCDLEKIEIVSDPIQVSTPLVIISEPCQQLAISHDQPTAFQVKIRMKMFKPLKLPLLLHPYLDHCYEYLPLFSEENQASAERHLESFLDFVDRFQPAHEDVIMRFFSKSLIKDAVVWFKSLRVDSISSWTEFSNAFLKYWGKYKSLDSYLADFYALKREQDEALHVFNRRFYRVYHDMPLEVRPTETVAMIYYVMGFHSDLVLLLLERKSPSLTQLFEDAQEVEENIHVSRRIRDRDFFENLQVHEQAEYQYTSDFEQKSNEVGADLGQQQTCKFNSVSRSDFSGFAEYSRDRYACEAYDQFVNQEEPMMTDDCIGNYMFLNDPCSYDFSAVLSSSSEKFSEEKVVMIDDQNLRSREQEGDQLSSKGTAMVEQEAAIDVQLFPEEQHVSYLLCKDPVAAFMDLYFSENLKISDFLSLPVFLGNYGFLKNFLSLLLHVQHHLLISDKDEISSVFKLLEWLLWKSAFT